MFERHDAGQCAGTEAAHAEHVNNYKPFCVVPGILPYRDKIGTIILIVISVLIGLYVHAFFSRYQRNHPEKAAVMVEFEALLDAWNRNDTNAVRSLCVSGFDPYAEENFVHVNFLLTTQNGTGRGVLQRNADGRFAFFPHGSLSWFPPGYVHGRVYFYAKENGTWKFTGNTEFYVD